MCPMVTPWMLRNLHTHLLKLSGTFMIFLYSCFNSSDLPTVRQFLLKQTQLKCVMFGGPKGTTKNETDTVKVMKCYSGIAT